MPVFNEKQKEAITCESGPVLVIAGPGSGKTFTICHRICYLIKEHNIDPSSILVITFSKSSAMEMQQRFFQLVQEHFYPVSFGTFHSIFFQIIKRFFHYETSNILTISQKRSFLKQILLEQKLVEQVDTELLDSLLSRIAYYKNSGEMEDKEQDFLIPREIFIKIYFSYQHLLKKERKLDFEDMMLLCHKILNENREVLQFYQQQYQYILVDEFQDINRIQYEIVKLLAMPQNNLFVVGDDDQSIYRFRGASPAIMQQFEKDYKEVKRIVLNMNYRSTKEIVNCAAIMIKENTNRFTKETGTLKSNLNSVTIKGFESKEEEYLYLMQQLKQIEPDKLTDTACLFRTNIEASGFAEQLLEHQIPFIMKEKLFLTYQSVVFLDFLHYFKLVDSQEPYALEDFIPIMNKPTRYFSRNKLLGETITFSQLQQIYSNKPYMKPIIQKMEYDLKRMKKMDLFSRVNYIRKAIGYEEYLYQKNKLTTIEETLNNIQNKMKNFSNLSELIKNMEEIKNEMDKKEDNGINLMTFHASKGLEFEKVYIMDCNEGSIPNKKSIGLEEIEEERRMFYVAMTRARESLNICYVSGTKQSPHMPSRFLRHIIKVTVI